MADEPAKILLGDTAITAIERTPGRRWFRRSKDQPRRLTHCENCGAQMQGHWCAQCGQAAVDYRRSFRHVIADVLDSFLNWDSKFFATIGLLITRPWRLTNEFLSGKRVRYLHPARLYFLASILFFFAVTYWVKSAHLNPKSLKQIILIAHSRILIIPIPHRRPTDLRSGLKAAPKKNSANVERTFSCSL